MRKCESPFCEVQFDPKTHNHKYHDPKCKRDAENVVRRRSAAPAALVEEARILNVPEVEEEDRLAYLRAQNQRLFRENLRLKTERAEQGTVLYDALGDYIKRNPLTPTVRPAIPKKHKGTPETAVAILSDWQLGKRTIDYDTKTCAERINLYMDKLFRITDIQRNDHPVPDVHLWVLGDMVEGEAIFPSQAHHIDTSLHGQIMKTIEVLSNTVLKRCLEYFDNVKFVGIAGNHGAIGGRSRHEMHPETNADRIVYSGVKMFMEHEGRIQWDIPTGSTEGDFYTIDKIGGKNYLLFHGDQIKGAGSHATIERRIKNWAMGAIREHFHYAAMGHFHNPTRLTINHCIAYINGTTESSNGWAVEVLGSTGRPCQYLLFAHDDHGVTAEYPIYLDI